MGEVYRVAIHYDNDCGYIEYDIDTKKIKVVLDDTARRKAVEAYLAGRHVLRQAQQNLTEFKESTAQATENLAAFKQVLTKLWVNTDVLVDWSRPVTVR